MPVHLSNVVPLLLVLQSASIPQQSCDDLLGDGCELERRSAGFHVDGRVIACARARSTEGVPLPCLPWWCWLLHSESPLGLLLQEHPSGALVLFRDGVGAGLLSQATTTLSLDDDTSALNALLRLVTLAIVGMMSTASRAAERLADARTFSGLKTCGKLLMPLQVDEGGGGG